MNVTCPSCNTIYRVDPAKVPARGVRARCRVCQAVFTVARPEGLEAPAAPRPATPAGEPRAAPDHEPQDSWAERLLERTAPAPAAPPSPPAPAEVPPPPLAREPQPAPFDPPPAPAVAPPVVPASPPPEPRITAPRARPSVAIPPVVPTMPPRPSLGAHAPPASRGGPPPVSVPSAPPAEGPPKRAVNPFMSRDPQQKARRLARALISDLVVYYPDRRQEGLRKGNLKDVFSEEIKKSWEEYSDQVGKEIAESTSYFTDALNEILAGGQKVF